MKKLTRRGATKGLAASLVGMTLVPSHAQCVRAKIVEECFTNQEKATSLAFEFLNGFAQFTNEECKKTRKAIMEGKEDEEQRWFDRFVGPVYSSLLYSHYLPIYWQAVRLCFLLNVDGFKILQLHSDQKEEIIDLGKRRISIEEMVKDKHLSENQAKLLSTALLTAIS